MGNTYIRRALHTRNLDEANKLKWALIARIKRELEELKSTDPDGIKAGLYRDAVKEAKGAEDHNSVMLLEECAAEHAEVVHKATVSLAKAQEWYQKATTDQRVALNTYAKSEAIRAAWIVAWFYPRWHTTPFI